MDIMEIVLLAAGGIVFILSFLIPTKKEESSEETRELAKEEIKAMVSEELEAVRGHVDDVVEEAVTYSIEKTERSLERLSNEKIMAVNEYSDTVLAEIHKNHEEVMFLYDMLNDKHINLKNTVSEVNRTVKEVKETKKEAEEVVNTFQRLAPETVIPIQTPVSAIPPQIFAAAPRETISPVAVPVPVAVPPSDAQNVSKVFRDETPVPQKVSMASRQIFPAARKVTAAQSQAAPVPQQVTASLQASAQQVTASSQAAPVPQQVMSPSQILTRQTIVQPQTDPVLQQVISPSQVLAQQTMVPSQVSAQQISRASQNTPLTPQKVSPSSAQIPPTPQRVAQTPVMPQTSVASQTPVMPQIPVESQQPHPGSVQGGGMQQPSGVVSFTRETDVQGRNYNDRVLELYKSGKSNVAIARELNLGVGEVKLVIDLYKNRSEK